MSNYETANKIRRRLSIAIVISIPLVALLAYLFGDHEQFMKVLAASLTLFWLVLMFFRIRHFVYMIKSWFE